MIIADINVTGGTLTTAAAVATAVGGIVTGFLAFTRNKKTDKLTLYSQFVDDLHEEVARLRSQYEEDQQKWMTSREGWEEREAQLTHEVEVLKGQTRKLEHDLDLLKGRLSRSPLARREAAEKTIQELESELSRVYGELELLRSTATLDQKRAARAVLVETMRQLGIDLPYLPSTLTEHPKGSE